MSSDDSDVIVPEQIDEVHNVTNVSSHDQTPDIGLDAIVSDNVNPILVLPIGNQDDQIPNAVAVYEHNEEVPDIVASAKPPSFVMKHIKVIMLTVICLSAGISIWAVLGTQTMSKDSDNPASLEVEQLTAQVGYLENIAMTLEGVSIDKLSEGQVSKDWEEATNSHIIKFYEQNEGLGIRVNDIRTTINNNGSQVYPSREEGAMVISYSQSYDFSSKSNATNPEDFALDPFSSRRGKESYMTVLKNITSGLSTVKAIGDMFFFTPLPSSMPTTSSAPTTKPTLFPTNNPTTGSPTTNPTGGKKDAVARCPPCVERMCMSMWDPHVCGESKCEYSNPCLAMCAGYVEEDGITMSTTCSAGSQE